MWEGWKKKRRVGSERKKKCTGKVGDNGGLNWGTGPPYDRSSLRLWANKVEMNLAQTASRDFAVLRASELAMRLRRPNGLTAGSVQTLDLYSPVVTICTASLTFNSPTFCLHIVFMCFVWI